MRDKTCCFTGHRVIPKSEMSSLKKNLTSTLRSLISEGGIQYFGYGGALGFDMLCAECVLELKGEFPHISLILVAPCADQCKGWQESEVLRYESLKAQADKAVCLAQKYYNGCMQKRNRYLVDNSSVCVSYKRRQTGGTAYTVKYAESVGVRVIAL